MEDNEIMPLEKIEFTQHVLERYVERTMNKSGNEIKQFLAQNLDQVKEQILKLYQYSEPFWYGKNKDHNYTYFRINKNGWVIVIDKNKTKLVTLYKIDLGLGEEFNKEYIMAMTEKIRQEMQDIDNNRSSYETKIKENDEVINDLKSHNNLLQSQIKVNNDTIELLQKSSDLDLQKISIKEQELKAQIEKFIGAKMF